MLDNITRKMQIRSKLLRCFIIEIICTCLFLYGGFASSAQKTLGLGSTEDFTGLCIAWGISLALAAYIGANVSGAHMNPAVSLFVLVQGQLSFVYFLVYILAQSIGAFLAAAITYIHYYDIINAFDGGKRTMHGPTATASIFATFPNAHASFTGAFLDQMFATAFFCLTIGGITEARNKVPKFLQPALIGLSFTFVCLAFGLVSGNAVNPARDLMPRLFLFCVGYTWDVFSVWGHKWFLIPIVCPIIGALLASWIYSICAKMNSDQDEDLDTRPIIRLNSVSSTGSNVSGPYKLTIPVPAK